jgi:predicted transcriptional regulator of viral defense system
MTIQPRIVVTATAAVPPSRHIWSHGVEIRIVGIEPTEMFGIVDTWVEGPTRVPASDPETTIVDCLRRPELCGGYAEVDLGAWMVRDRIRIGVLVD